MPRALLLTLCLAAGLARAQFRIPSLEEPSSVGLTGTSNASSASSRATDTASQSSAESSGGSTGSSAATTNGSSNGSSGSSSNSGQSGSVVLLASSALVAVAGGIFTTVYVVKSEADAKRRAEQFRSLHPPQVPPDASPAPVAPQTLEPQPLAPPPLPPLEGPAQPDPQGQGGSAQAARGPTLDAMVLARAWLVANRLQLKQDLALGAGPALDDLAGIAGIPAEHRGHFGRVLQQHRAQLVAPAEVTPEQAAACLSRVGALVLADPLLRADGEAIVGTRSVQ